MPDTDPSNTLLGDVIADPAHLAEALRAHAWQALVLADSLTAVAPHLEQFVEHGRERSRHHAAAATAALGLLRWAGR